MNNFLIKSLSYLLLVVLLAFVIQNNVYAELCSECEEPDGDPYLCNGGDYCCTGGGCPQVMCEGNGNNQTGCTWDQNNDVCYNDTNCDIYPDPDQCDAADGCEWKVDDCTQSSCPDPGPGDTCTPCDEDPPCPDETPPDTPILASPINNTIVGSPVNFDWGGISDWGETYDNDCEQNNDNHFELYVELGNPNPATLVSGYIDDANSFYNGYIPLAEGTHYWRVYADNGGQDTPSAVGSFVVTLNGPPTCTGVSGPTTAFLDEANSYTGLGVSDPDGDTITRAWTASAGCTGSFVPNNSTTSNSTNWTPTALASSCTISLTVSDALHPNAATCSIGSVQVVERRVQGWVWDSTGLACSARSGVTDESSDPPPPNPGTEITPSSATLDPQVIKYGPGGYTATGDWNTSGYTGYSYEVTGVHSGANQTLSHNLTSYTSNLPPGFRYNLACLNDNSTPGPNALITINSGTSLLRADLGYNLSSTGWFQSINGDVYSGSDISVGIPTTVAATYDPYLTTSSSSPNTKAGGVYSAEDSSVIHPDSTDAYSEDGNRYARNLDSTTYPVDFWVNSLNFDPPSAATQLPLPGTPGDCTDMFDQSVASNRPDPDTVYYATAACVNKALETQGNNPYRISGNGLVVIYVTTTTPIVFGEGNTYFQSQLINDRRILFITKAPVEFHTDLGVAAPASTSRAMIEAAIISEQNITFNCEDADSNDVCDGTDDTVFVEGPLISKAGIEFLRDRGLNNNYPAEVVRYNPFYMDTIRDQELASSILNYTGMSTLTIDWKVSE